MISVRMPPSHRLIAYDTNASGITLKNILDFLCERRNASNCSVQIHFTRLDSKYTHSTMFRAQIYRELENRNSRNVLGSSN
jgi:hypothetical protein